MFVSFSVIAGPLQVLQFFRVDNKLRLLSAMKSAGWWLIGTSGNERANMRSIDAFDEHFYAATCPSDRPVLVLFGSEDLGISPELLDLCDVVLKIPGQSVSASMPSLNVSVSTGITLHILHQARQRHKSKHFTV